MNAEVESEAETHQPLAAVSDIELEALQTPEELLMIPALQMQLLGEFLLVSNGKPVTSIAPTATAVAALRDEAYVINIVAAWETSEASQHIAWARAFWEAMEPCATGGVYINFLNDEKEERIRASYGVNYDRLVALKNRYDPTNFFHFNHNIKPTVSL